MNELKVTKTPGGLMVDSRDVAEMVGKRHDHLLRDIDGYVEVLLLSTNPKIGVSDFFVGNSYISTQNKELPCYLLTRKGCDMVANKMTGEKGVLFTAAYVTKFEEMEKQSVKPQSIEDLIILQAQSVKDLKTQVTQQAKEITENKEAVQSIRDVVSLNTADWRNDTAKLITRAANKLGGNEHIRDLRKESYKLLDTRFGVSLEIRLTNKRQRMALEGVGKSKINALNHLDVIAEDKKLVEGYVAIVKDMAIKYGV